VHRGAVFSFFFSRIGSISDNQKKTFFTTNFFFAPRFRRRRTAAGAMSPGQKLKLCKYKAPPGAISHRAVHFWSDTPCGIRHLFFENCKKTVILVTDSGIAPDVAQVLWTGI
jgi:hypothetical protein